MFDLGAEVVAFETCSSSSDIFFDSLNKKICTVRGNGEMGVTAKGLEGGPDNVISFRIKDQGRIKLLCFSTDSQLASLQRDDFSVDFVLLEQRVSSGYLPEVKHVGRKRVPLLGHQWVGDRHLLFITAEGIDLYAISIRKKTVKCQLSKSVSSPINWFTCYIIISASGISNAILTPFIVQNGLIHRLSKFEAEFGCSGVKPKLNERDITIGLIYDHICVLVLKSGGVEGVLERLNIYELSSTDPLEVPALTKTLRLDIAGLVGIHIIDNLILVHHRNSSSSLVFDVGPSGPAPELKTAIPVEAICTTSVEIARPLAEMPIGGEEESLSLYSPTWVILPPDIVADARLGVFSRIRLRLEPATRLIADKATLLDFLTRRAHAEPLFLRVFEECLLRRDITIQQVCSLFRRILSARTPIMGVDGGVMDVLSPSKEHSSSQRCQLVIEEPFQPMELDHNTILHSIFDPLRERMADKSFLAYLVLEYFLTVKRLRIPMENHYLPELLLRVLVEAGQLSKLQQLLQYRVIDDSKFLAYELITLGRDSPSLHQMALDMLSRRGNAEQIAEVLISQGKVVEALRSIADQTQVDRVLCHKLLEATWSTNNRQLKHAVFLHLRNTKKAPYLTDESCEEFKRFITEFKELFHKNEIEEAESRFRLARICSVRKKANSIAVFNDDEHQQQEETDGGAAEGIPTPITPTTPTMPQNSV